MVKKIYIYTCEEAKRLSPKAKLPPLSEIIKATPKKVSSDADMACNGPEDPGPT